MADFSYFATAGPAGTHQCCLCFSYIAIADLFVDQSGQKWDMCKPCAENDTLTDGPLVPKP